MKILSIVSDEKLNVGQELSLSEGKVGVILEVNEVEITEENSDTKSLQYQAKYAEKQEGSTSSKLVKDYRLSTLTVTIDDKIFYADPNSRADISEAVNVAEEEGLTETNWKCKNGIKTVTISELKKVRMLALQKKAEIIGISQ